MIPVRVVPSSLLAAVALLSCVAIPPQADEATLPPTGEASAAPVAAPPEIPPPSQAPASAAERPLSFTGEMTQGGWIRGTLPAGTVSAYLGDTPLDFDAEGRFFAAFDRDAPREIVMKVTQASGAAVERVVTVSPRAWDIERVDVARRPGGSDEEWWKQREPEWLAIRDARAKKTGAQGWKQDFIWPVTGRISGRFGRQRIYRGEPGSYHSGLDIAPGNGVPFVAPADGVVVLARTGFSLEGGIVIVDHGAGLNSAFIHLSRIAVAEGEKVLQGQVLGAVGSSGRATGPHLHWSLMWRDARLDPLLFLPPMP